MKMRPIFIPIFLLICCCTVACVSKSKYKTLQKNYQELLTEQKTIVKYAADTKRTLTKLQDEHLDLQTRAVTGSNTCKQQLQLLVDSLQKLKINYENQLKSTIVNQSSQSQKFQAYEQQLAAQKRQQDALAARNQLVFKYLTDSVVWMDTANLRLEQRQNKVCLLLFNKMVRPDTRSWDVPSVQILFKLTNFLVQNADLQIMVVGHSAKRSSAATNLETAQARANSLALFLMEKGVAPKRIFATGRAFYDLALGITAEEQKQRNECIEIRISTEKLAY